MRIEDVVAAWNTQADAIDADERVNFALQCANNGWMPIETVPTTHSGALVHLFANGEIFLDCFFGSATCQWVTGWATGNIVYVNQEDVTHWALKLTPPSV